MRLAIVLLLAMLASGCGRDDMKVYRVAKEDASPQQPVAQTMPGGHPGVASAPPRLQWKLPAGWEEMAPGEMRVASFKVKGQGTNQADVSVIPLAGMAGGDLNNVNRWRSQVGLAPVTQAELAKLAEEIEIAGSKASLYDQAGLNPADGGKSRILAVALYREDTAWFFKMTGDDELVAQQKPAFVEFLKSLQFAAAGAQPMALPPSHPPIGPVGAEPAAAGNPGKPNWTVPAGWKEEPPTQMLIAKFVATEADARAEITVSAFPGDVGGMLANVNRWRQQLGLPEIGGADLPKTVSEVAAQGGKATLVELAGTDARTGQKAKLVGVILPQASQTWFYKMMGNEKVVARERDALIKFVQSAR